MQQGALARSGSQSRQGQSLKLDSIKNNSHQFNYCPNSPGYFQGVKQENDFLKVKRIRGNVPCKKWSCEYCRPNNLKRLRARIFNSDMVQNYKQKGFRDRYSQKFLTLTYPGKDHREKFSPLEAYEQMTKSFDKLVRAIKKKRGEFKYLRVVEPQKDGYPHLHCVIVGKSIAKKEVLQEMRDLWCSKYGMGFIRLNVITKSLEHAIRYITKYLSKNPQSMGKNKRIFTSSRGGLQKMAKNEWIEKQFFYGTVKTGKDGETEVIEHEVKLSENETVNGLAEHLHRELVMEMFGIDIFEEKRKIIEKGVSECLK